jgi:hypothetical protein
MPIIYRKTAKGIAEIETRIYRLAPRLRSMLIVVDGRRSDADLGSMMPQAAESLAALMQEGFIEELAHLVTTPAPLPPPAAPAGPPAPNPRFEAMKRDLIRAFNDRIGPAGENIAIKMERAATEDEFRALLPQAVRLIGLAQGKAASDLFAARIDAW